MVLQKKLRQITSHSSDLSSRRDCKEGGSLTSYAVSGFGSCTLLLREFEIGGAGLLIADRVFMDSWHL